METKDILFELTQKEQVSLQSDLNRILQVASNPRAYQYSPFVRFTEIPGAITAVNRLKKLMDDFPKGTTSFNVRLTDADCIALKKTMNQLLLGFNRTPGYEVGVTDNPVLALALGKVYYAVSGEEHPHLHKEHFNDMIQYRINAIRRSGKDIKEIRQLQEMLK